MAATLGELILNFQGADTAYTASVDGQAVAQTAYDAATAALVTAKQTIRDATTLRNVAIDDLVTALTEAKIPLPADAAAALRAAA